MPRPEKIKELLDEHYGEFPEHTGLGRKSMIYLTMDGGWLCAKCANENIELTDDPNDEQWYIIDYTSEWAEEDDEKICDNCYETIPVVFHR